MTAVLWQSAGPEASAPGCFGDGETPMDWPPKNDQSFADCPEDLLRAHNHSSCHRAELLSSDICGCFYCLATFRVSEVVEWIDEDDAGEGQTALCPHCTIDSVIGDQSGFPVSREFLDRMSAYWF